MDQCEYCGDSADLPYRCNYCGGRYCPDHRLPEGHECDGVEFLSGSQEWFRNKETGTVVSSSAEFEAPEPIDPEYTVGTTPSPDYESSPEVEIRSDAGSQDDSNNGFLSRIFQRLLGR